MRAAVRSRYGPPEVIQVTEVEKPVPKFNEVLIRIHATTVCAADWRLRKADPFMARFFSGLLRPKKVRILGMEFSGTIASLGSDVTRFRVGDEVFGSPLLKFGTHAEYVCMPADGLIEKRPANMPLDECAAVLFGGLTVLGFLGRAKINPGDKVLVNGASGSVGIFAVQIAKHYGAHVTAVCSKANADMVKSLGADEAIDYTKEDFSKAGRVYDMVFDTVGKAGLGRSLKSLKRGGYYVVVAGVGRKTMLGDVFVGTLVQIWGRITGAMKLIGMPKKGGLANVAFLKELIEAGKVRTVIEKRYRLEEISKAHRHAEGGHKKGHVLITFD